MTDEPAKHWRTKLLHPAVTASLDFRALAPAVHRGSTVLFDRVAEARDDWRGEGYSYGLYGTPTTRELAVRVADLEGARSSFVVPGGQAAIALVYLALCRAGDHALVPESAYRPNRDLAEKLLAGSGSRSRPTTP